MSELRMGDVRARGCGFTLCPAAREANVDSKLMIALLDAAEYKFEKMAIGTTKKKRRPYWPQLYTKSELLNYSCRSVPIEDLIIAGLITPASERKDTNYFLTQKALNIFLRAKAIDQKLQRNNFHYCPCSMF